ncbi:PREDICTED: opsin, blue-sensitive-like [Nicrophorus vespilloides]|uniref:Opsin, blue-sensitive-like n=1 Tax=Nicrophorus vespilloides TaxID=110193 RepID=A0ABM1MCI8_NICVS|nr:PREDICTED: opsin, blue-sensitive-like [Nicrophorus vespilloides]
MLWLVVVVIMMSLGVLSSEVRSNLTVDGKLLEVFAKRYPLEEWTRHGFFHKDYLRRINAHWLGFEPQPARYHYALSVLYGFIMVGGVTGNALVIVMFIRCKRLRTPALTLIVNLAFSDIMMMTKLPIFIYNSIYMGPALGEYACRLYGFIGALSGTCSISTLAAISVDRFFVVRYPLNQRFTGTRARVCVVITWVYSVTFSIIPLLDVGLGVYTPEGFLTSCSYDYLTDNEAAKNFILVFFVAAWVVPFILIVCTYASNVSVVMKSKRMIRQRGSARHIRVEEKRSQEMRLTMIVFLVIVMWFVAWTPYAVVSLIGIAGRADLITPLTSMIPALFCKTVSCIDPYVYALTHPKFKAELRALFCRRRPSAEKSNVSSFQATSRGNKRREFARDDGTEMVQLECIRLPIIQKQDNKPPPRLNVDEMKKGSSAYSTRWWYKPSFSNRTSSIRGIARSFTSRTQSFEVD